ncbi:MAG: uracil-DNA glycosylase [Alphaproteobacteria bacterium]
MTLGQIKMNFQDEPKSLGIKEVRTARFSLLCEEHIFPLTHFVEQERAELGFQDKIPYFDPLDGGARAKVLFVLEAPGAKAVASGFISRNNPDETAKNMFCLLNEAGFERDETVLWNIVPWYIGSGQKIRPANGMDIQDGMQYLSKLINLLSDLQSLVLVGKKAAKAKNELAELISLPIFETYHPSPLFVNKKPGNRDLILGSFREVRESVRR